MITAGRVSTLNTHKDNSQRLGDFTTSVRVIPISLLAIGIGLLSTGVAWALLRLIGFFTNVFYYGRASTVLSSPAENHLGWWAVLVPVAGGIVIGLMARYGSERIRGHGIPEALESILINGSKVQPRLAILKPLSSAISIGSGGPFGAEGPIIMTAGAFGSIIAQLFHLTAAERKTLLVAGAAAGMSATFATPIAAVLLAVELLLFEWKPRSAIPVALASAAAGAGRRYILGLGPLFPVPQHAIFIGPQGLMGCVIAGLLAGVLSSLLTLGVYAAEDGFKKIPIHWMWWPAIGGVFVGFGGMIFPQALGVGYDTIRNLLQGDVPREMFAGVLLVKSAIWIISLGSGTSGGVLAPLLMMGAALGGVEAGFLPHEGAGFWPLISMGAILGGTMRAPFTAILFALELTHDINVLLPLLVAAMLAHATTVLLLKRSILTEKVARRGFHITREYATDPLEILFAREVMRTKVVALPANSTVEDLRQLALREPTPRGQHLYPIVDDERRVSGVITRKKLRELTQSASLGASLGDLVRSPVVAHSDEPLRVIVFRMAETGLTRMPVLDSESGKLVGMISLDDMLMARVRNLNEERHRERLLELRFPFRSQREIA
ncbi:MAG TPA: chloride channel protein [Bryobacteraceae bacterium]|nr:chloride channel protein [Bryobacteraceae bacterium]